jgi:hypothetical protein
MTKEQECMKALQCLYLEVPSVIADDVKQKVIDALNEVKNCTIPDVIKSLPDSDEIRMKARELDEKDFAQWMYELQKGNVL